MPKKLPFNVIHSPRKYLLKLCLVSFYLLVIVNNFAVAEDSTTNPADTLPTTNDGSNFQCDEASGNCEFSSLGGNLPYARNPLNQSLVDTALTKSLVAPAISNAEQSTIANFVNQQNSFKVQIGDLIAYIERTQGPEQARFYQQAIDTCIQEGRRRDPNISISEIQNSCVTNPNETVNDPSQPQGGGETIDITRLPSGESAPPGAICTSNMVRAWINVRQNESGIGPDEIDIARAQVEEKLDRMLNFVGDMCKEEIPSATEDNKYKLFLVAPLLAVDDNNPKALRRLLAKVAYEDMLAILYSRCACENEPVNVKTHGVFDQNSARCISSATAGNDDSLLVAARLKMGAYGSPENIKRLRRLQIQGVGGFLDIAECVYTRFSDDTAARTTSSSSGGDTGRSNSLANFLPPLSNNWSQGSSSSTGAARPPWGASRKPTAGESISINFGKSSNSNTDDGWSSGGVPNGNGGNSSNGGGSGSSMMCGLFAPDGPLNWDTVSQNGDLSASLRVNSLIKFAQGVALNNSYGLKLDTLGFMKQISGLEALIPDVEKLFAHRIGLSTDQQIFTELDKIKPLVTKILEECEAEKGRSGTQLSFGRNGN